LACSSSAADLLDEREYVDAVLEQEPDIAWSPVHLSAANGVAAAVDPDLPSFWPPLAACQSACAAAARSGAHLLLSGAGGDEAATYNAVGLHAALFRQLSWSSLPGEMRLWAQRRSQPLMRALAERVLIPLVPEPLYEATRRIRSRPPRYVRRSALCLLDPGLAREVAASLEPARSHANSPADRIHLLTRSYLAGRAAHWAILGARHGVAFTYPLMDRRVLDFVLSLPLKHFAHDGWTRQPFRNAMAGILPEKIRLRQSKFTYYPDLSLFLASVKSDLLLDWETLRRNPAAIAFANMAAVGEAIQAIPEGEAARRIAESINRAPLSGVPVSRCMAAVTALQLARHLAEIA
jgi:asparagine synthase (glutamine-hydrolysing)